MAYKKINPAYYGTVALTLATTASKFMIQSWLEPFLNAERLWWLIAIFIVFGLGIACADLYNPNSALRHNWREFWRIFKVLAAYAGEQSVPHEYIGMWCLLKFTKKVRRANINVRVIAHSVHGDTVKVVHSESLADVPKDFEKRILLGSMPVQKPGWVPRHAVWGADLAGTDLVPTQHPITPGGRFTLEISVNHQVYRLHAYMLDASRPESGRVFLLKDEDIPEH